MEQNNDIESAGAAASGRPGERSQYAVFLLCVLIAVSGYAGYEHRLRRQVEGDLARLQKQMDLESREKEDLISRERRMIQEGGIAPESIQWNLTYDRASERNDLEVRVVNPYQHHRLSFGLKLTGETVRWMKEGRGSDHANVSLALDFSNLAPGESRVIHRHFPARVETQAFSGAGRLADMVRICDGPVFEAPIREDSIQLQIYAQKASPLEFAAVKRGTPFSNVRDFQSAARKQLGQ